MLSLVTVLMLMSEPSRTSSVQQQLDALREQVAIQAAQLERQAAAMERQAAQLHELASSSHQSEGPSGRRLQSTPSAYLHLAGESPTIFFGQNQEVQLAANDTTLAVDAASAIFQGTIHASSLHGDGTSLLGVQLQIADQCSNDQWMVGVQANGSVVCRQLPDPPEVPVEVPVGTVVMWSGSYSSIPMGWQLCDGSNGAPDLRDRFIIGAGPGSKSVGATGGADEYSISSPTVSVNTRADVCYAPHWQVHACVAKTTVATSASISGSGAQTVGLPPFYALAYMIKV